MGLFDNNIQSDLSWDSVVILPRFYTTSMPCTFCGQPTSGNPKVNVPTLMVGPEIVAVMCQKCRRTRIEDLPNVSR